MHFRKELLFNGSPEQVYAVLSDESFRRKVAERAGSTQTDITTEQTPEGLVATICSRQPAPDLPGPMAGLLGSELRVDQKETWISNDQAELEVTIHGKPGHIKGMVWLEPRGGQTAQILDAEVHARIPLIGGKVEKVICRVLGSIQKLQCEVANEILAG
jgi:hypothetical protein